MGRNPEVTVAAVVSHDRKFLFVEEMIGGRLVLNQPAGHLEDHETLLDAVIRETREETAWRFVPGALVGTYLWRSPNDGRSFLRFAFCGEVEDHQPQRVLDTGIVRAVWLSPEELDAAPERLRSPLVMRCVRDYLLGRRQPLDSVARLDLASALRVPAVVNL
jgi:8-oxo-dGTP pyrophosphatase MutT (NUDIX family)